MANESKRVSYDPNRLQGQKNGPGGDVHPMPDCTETVVDRQRLAVSG